MGVEQRISTEVSNRNKAYCALKGNLLNIQSSWTIKPRGHLQYHFIYLLDFHSADWNNSSLHYELIGQYRHQKDKDLKEK